MSTRRANIGLTFGLLLGAACDPKSPAEPTSPAEDQQHNQPRAAPTATAQPQVVESMKATSLSSVGAAEASERAAKGEMTTADDPHPSKQTRAPEAQAHHGASAHDEPRLGGPGRATPAEQTPPTKSRAHAVFRPRAGRRLHGTVDLEQHESGVQLDVHIRGLPSSARALQLFRTEDCAPFGAGMGKFSSAHMAGPVPLASVGRLVLEQGRAERSFQLDAATLDRSDETSLRGQALVVYGPVTVHGAPVQEPLACASIPRT